MNDALESAHDQINALRYHIQLLEEKLKQFDWQPIETAPRDGAYILISNPAWKRAWQGCWMRKDMLRPDEDEHWTRLNCHDIGLSPSHWMPLPLPPEGK